jgi:hypothetical protein
MALEASTVLVARSFTPKIYCVLDANGRKKPR